jgi:uncharacterized protein YbcC (UPF0753/DUF2309 family)
MIAVVKPLPTRKLDGVAGTSLAQLQLVLQRVRDTVSPVWPLRDMVAVNPFAGWTVDHLLQAEGVLRSVSECQLLPSLPQFAKLFANGHFNASDIQAAMREMVHDTALPAMQATASPITYEAVRDLLESHTSQVSSKPSEPRTDSNRLRSYAEIIDNWNSTQWQQQITEEIGKYCSAYYDQGHSRWSHPYQHWSLYQAWKSLAIYDRALEFAGLPGFRKFVGSLPYSTIDTIHYSLRNLGVPEWLWERYLMCLVLQTPGWFAWARFRMEKRMDPAGIAHDFDDLLAIRLAYEAALHAGSRLRVDWNHIPKVHHDEATWVRWILLRANELAFQRKLLESIQANQSHSLRNESKPQPTSPRKLAQVVCCIDVRSERWRRHLEAQGDDIESFGFAGFFGMPIEYQASPGQDSVPHVPALISPSYRCVAAPRSQQQAASNGLVHLAQQALCRSTQQLRALSSIWQSLCKSTVACFTSVEASGPGALSKLLAASWRVQFNQLGRTRLGKAVSETTQDELILQHVEPAQQLALAKNMLTQLGLLTGFAKIVVLCGHGSQSTNNPSAASLDCGACGGHSGAPNARVAAQLLNTPSIRDGLAECGIAIPSDTLFIAAHHNTTTDELTFLSDQPCPESHSEAFETLLQRATIATRLTRQERLPSLHSYSDADITARSLDWSEVRPELALAGNAAFIIGPREATRGCNLQGRVFMHSYQAEQDMTGDVLAAIMTAPLVVAHWINMQYYASTVDPQHFGSGSKTIHNVVGKFGLLSGSGGDLRTGLAWESVNSSAGELHIPQRLLCLIAAPRKRVERILGQHANVAQLVNNRWMHLIVSEQGQYWQYLGPQNWQLV